ncbi:MAG: hypothetical protein C4519_10920, partial [Desulfobacteraceae bacterium]
MTALNKKTRRSRRQTRTSRRSGWMIPPFFYMTMLLIIFASTAEAATTVSGTIAVDTIWSLAGSPYIVTGSITVQGTDGDDGVTTLTIEPGVQMRFNSGCGLYVGNSSGSPGALVAQGTPEAPIVFTANSSSPTPGYWVGINFRNTASDASCRLEHCTVAYAGNSYSNYAAVRVEASNPALVACTFEHSVRYDLDYTSNAAGTLSGCTFNHGIDFSAGGSVVLDSNIVNWTNSYPVKLPANRVAPFANSTTFNNLSASSALVVTDGSLTADSTWPATIAYRLTNSLTVQGTSG